MRGTVKTVAIIVAAGRGKRMGKPKQFLKIAGRPMLEWTLSAFQKSRIIDGIILVIEKENIPRVKQLKFSKLIAVVEGGEERQDSVAKGLSELPASSEIILVHDGARPGVTGDRILSAVKAARRYGAAVVGVPVKDTIKMTNGKCSRFAGSRNNYSNIVEAGQMTNEGAKILRTLDRNNLWAAQTPQAFRKSIIIKAYSEIKGEFTDDAGLVEKMGYPVKMVIGSYENIKVTTPEDLKLMGIILKDRRG